MARTRDFAKVVRKKIQSDPALAKAVEDDLFNVNIAMQIYDARTRAGMTQEAVAKAIDSKQSVIARMEDADYRGHSLTVLRKIADAVNCTLFVEFRPKVVSGESCEAATSMISDVDTSVDGVGFTSDPEIVSRSNHVEYCET